MTQVKLCGIRTLSHAQAAIDAGAEYLGFVLAAGRRQVSPDTIREIIAELGPSRARYVGVFVDADPDEARNVAIYAGLDVVQLSGSESPDDVVRVGVPAFKVVHVRPEADIQAEVERYAGVAEMVMLDTYRATAAGGTGEAFDWSAAGEVAARYPVMVAGGLRPDNVAEAIRAVHPAAVDVSSGIETRGEKDPAKMQAFVAAVRGTQL
ncbi:MAG: phosphoribosylanthranilate isomerase [Chloroflexota bacterium]|nr:phosphoribosylanthranilate isomerase [Chloroflexota bacterium]